VDPEDETAWLRDATRPYIRPFTRGVLAVLILVLLVVTWIAGGHHNSADAIVVAILLGIVSGACVAACDVAVGREGSELVVRNALLVSRVPFAAIERVDTRLGVYLRTRGRRLAVRVPVSSGFFRSKARLPLVAAEDIERYLGEASPDPSARAQARLKATWLLTIPAAVVVFAVVEVISQAAH